MTMKHKITFNGQPTYLRHWEKETTNNVYYYPVCCKDDSNELAEDACIITTVPGLKMDWWDDGDEYTLHEWSTMSYADRREFRLCVGRPTLIDLVFALFGKGIRRREL